MSPRKFTDAAGREWSIIIDVPNLKRVRAALGCCPLDLLQPTKAEGWLDPVRLVDTLYVLAKPQADAAGVSDEEFGRGLVGDAMEAGTRALVDAVIDYLPPARGETFRIAYTRLATAETIVFGRACEAVAKAADAAVGIVTPEPAPLPN